MGRLVIDGNSVYEIDEECMRKKERERKQKEKSEDWRHGDKEPVKEKES